MRNYHKLSLILLSLISSAPWANTSTADTRDPAFHENIATHHDIEHTDHNSRYIPSALYPDVHLIDKREKRQKQLSTQLILPPQSTDAETTCPYNVFTGLKGAVFLAAIKNNGRECINTLFNDRPETQALGAYSDANFSTVINEIKTKMVSYNGLNDTDYISSLFYWLKAYAYYDQRRFVTPTTQHGMEEAINAVYQNSHFFDKSAQHALVVRNATGIIKNAVIGERFIHITRAMLSRYNAEYEQIDNWGQAVTPLFWQTLSTCAKQVSCRADEHNKALIIEIVDFINANLTWLTKSDNDYHLFNLGYQLANMYRGKNDPHFAAIQTELTKHISTIFDSFGPLEDDKARTLYLAVLESINYNNMCSAYNVCHKTQEIITQVLGDRKTCPSGTLFIWAQDMNQQQLEWTCNSLKSHENHFHSTLQTNRVPVVPDDNDKLRMIIFNDKKEWVTYGGALFNVSTNNGGTYREGDPSRSGDQATFYAYEHISERPIFDIWNLRHEYIHYLEGRFVSKGSFRDSDDAGRTVWFGEGIAEYISLKNCNDDAIDIARTKKYPLSTIFNNEYGVGQERIYDWGYLANRFMFERKNSQFFQMMSLFKEGQFQTYRDDLVDVWIDTQPFDAEFANWLSTVNSYGCKIDTTRPPSPVEPKNPDDYQGPDTVAVNACHLGRPNLDFTLSAGVASCLTGQITGKTREYGLPVPQGFKNVSLQLTLRHGSGNADLYHEHGSANNGSQYEHKSTGPTNSETIVIDNVKPGWNYIGIKATNTFNNTTLLARYIQNSFEDDLTLKNNVGKMVSVSEQQQVTYSMSVPDNASSLTFSTVGGAGESDMHVKYGSAPTLSDFECRPWKVGTTETCHIRNVKAGTYYIMLSADPSFTNVTLTGRYNTLD
ncbi:M9 family metallopeptidase [Pseudoalteromonas sp. MMG005]|uniref:M9 family metallopeptidase n=1 Tax=Pseudoalteromonas sp. MMG005 TaxID=2822682 RepID=UPI001B39D3C2|nr:M9 family metallopeptidase [Pseudoalteromonas sp. MMG005]MBQ4846684.1 collagenase [Pseudoalteromonas sp. MMG005]